MTAALRFVSKLNRTRGGVGFTSDDRDNNRLEEMGCIVGETTPNGELRTFSKSYGAGQSWSFDNMIDTCACCGKEASVNIVTLCDDCNWKELTHPDHAEVAKQERQVARHIADARRRIHGVRLSLAVA